MQKYIIIIIIVCTMSEMAIGSRIGRRPPAKLIREADVIVIAEVANIATQDRKRIFTTCARYYTISLKPKSFIKNNIVLNEVLSFRFLVLIDDRDPCPRLYYINPPKASSIRKKGATVIATLKKNASGVQATYTVTGTFDIEDLGKVKKCLKGQIKEW